MASIPIPILKDETYTFEGFVSQADKQESDYLLLPFDVPDGVVRLDVRYEYSDETGAELWAPSGNVIDLGVFDSRGSEFITARGFRGTSGSFRHGFSIGLNEATPGYLAGPIYSGRWCIMLGLYRIVPRGCRYRVVVEMTQGEAEPIPEVEPYDAGVLCSDARWYKGDLHCHTHHSDASGTIGDLVQSARARGLDFLAVTDHNTISHLREFARYATADLLLIPGEEITTYYGHANLWGIEKWHDFRAGCAADMQRIIDEASRSGSLVSINHPKEEGPPWTFDPIRGYDCIEAWQAYWFVNNYQSLAFWDERLRKGRRITIVGGSDCHMAAPDKDPSPVIIGAPTTWVYATELSVKGILDGIRAGHVFVSSNPDDGPRVYLAAVYGDVRAVAGDDLCVPRGTEVKFSIKVTGAGGMMLRFVAAQGEVALVGVEDDDFTYGYALKVSGTNYLRVEVIAPPEADLKTEPAALWVEALSNPIYLRIAS